MTVEEPTDTDIFLASLDRCLCPALRPGDVVVMDNLSAHKAPEVRDRIQAAGAELLYLPPYSPDLNPIEKAWSRLRALLRRTKPRTAEALDQAITELLPQITPVNAQARSDFDSAQLTNYENALSIKTTLVWLPRGRDAGKQAAAPASQTRHVPSL